VSSIKKKAGTKEHCPCGAPLQTKDLLLNPKLLDKEGIKYKKLVNFVIYVFSIKNDIN
jgi:hypothetical protein